MPIKFKSQFDLKIDGFWRPEMPEKEGDPFESIEGIYSAHVRNSAFPFHVLEIVEDQETVALAVQDEKGETLEEISYGVAKGMRVGLSNWTEFKGLEEYVGHHMTIKFVGYEALSRGREKRLFDIEVSDRPIPGHGARDKDSGSRRRRPERTARPAPPPPNGSKSAAKA